MSKQLAYIALGRNTLSMQAVMTAAVLYSAKLDRKILQTAYCRWHSADTL